MQGFLLFNSGSIATTGITKETADIVMKKVIQKEEKDWTHIDRRLKKRPIQTLK